MPPEASSAITESSELAPVSFDLGSICEIFADVSNSIESQFAEEFSNSIQLVTGTTSAVLVTQIHDLKKISEMQGLHFRHIKMTFECESVIAELSISVFRDQSKLILRGSEDAVFELQKIIRKSCREITQLQQSFIEISAGALFALLCSFISFPLSMTARIVSTILLLGTQFVAAIFSHRPTVFYRKDGTLVSHMNLLREVDPRIHLVRIGICAFAIFFSYSASHYVPSLESKQLAIAVPLLKTINVNYWDHYEQQITFLKRSTEEFDKGNEDEAKRMASTLMLLFAGQGEDGIFDNLGVSRFHLFKSFSREHHPGNLIAETGLTAMQWKPGSYLKHVPHLEDDWGGVFKANKKKTFGDWWNESVIRVPNYGNFTRGELVAYVAGQGGIKVASTVDPKLHAVNEENLHGWRTYQGLQVEGAPPDNKVADVSVRTIAAEVIASYQNLIEIRKLKEDKGF